MGMSTEKKNTPVISYFSPVKSQTEFAKMVKPVIKSLSKLKHTHLNYTAHITVKSTGLICVVRSFLPFFNNFINK